MELGGASREIEGIQDQKKEREKALNFSSLKKRKKLRRPSRPRFFTIVVFPWDEG